MTLIEITKAILRCCPEWTIDSIYYLAEGDFCSAYVVNDEWVFRFAKHDKARASLKREYCLLPKLANQITLPIPSPQIASFEDNPKLSFIAYPLLHGHALSQEQYFTLEEASRTHCAKQVAHFLNQMHSVNVRLAEDCHVLTNEYANRCSDLLKRARENLFPILDKPECLFIERVIGSYLESSGNTSDFRSTLLHGDLSPDHVLFDEKTKRVTAIIDFGDIMIGDPAWDFLWIYEDYGLDFLSRMLPAYRESDQPALLQRVFQFSLLQTIDWAIICQVKGDNAFMEAMTQLRTMRVQEEAQFTELLLTCGFA
ncbi:phosphotransferase [Nostoc sp. UHCC 0251]|nr:phosphotransferase [Nostoc sp. UHCC 0251]